MEIYVEETTINKNGKKFIVKEVISESEFIRFYGDDYSLTQLKTQGKTGDAIGQGRWMYAEILTEDLKIELMLDGLIQCYQETSNLFLQQYFETRKEGIKC
jgi:hypothetical protein